MEEKLFKTEKILREVISGTFQNIEIFLRYLIHLRSQFVTTFVLPNQVNLV